MTCGILSRFLFASSLIACVACSGAAKPAKTADDSDTADKADKTEASSTSESSESAESADGDAKKAKPKEEGWNDVEQKDVSAEQKGSRKKPASGSASNSVKDNPEPEFKEGGTVDEAIKAVPQGLPRENIEQESLDKPLLNVDLYKPCKLGQGAHFEVKFAVWNGRCVGMDIKTMPKNAKLETCLREVVSNAKWQDKTKSLNISTVSF